MKVLWPCEACRQAGCVEVENDSFWDVQHAILEAHHNISPACQDPDLGIINLRFILGKSLPPWATRRITELPTH